MKKATSLFICSNGGHLLQLLYAEKHASNFDAIWICLKKADSESLLEGKNVYWAFHPTNRNIPNLMRNLLLAVRIMWTHKPARIISTGAGVAIPFFFLAKFLPTCRSCYIESFARFTSPSLSGKVCYRLADRFLYQWPELKKFYAKGKYAGSLY